MKLRDWLIKNTNANKIKVKYFNRKKLEYYVDLEDFTPYLDCKVVDVEIVKDRDFITATCWLDTDEVLRVKKVIL